MSLTDVVTVLSISPVLEDHRRLENIFSHSNWRLCRAENGTDAVSKLIEEPAPVVITESHLPDRTWHGLLELFGELTPPRPRLIVASRLADDSFWQDVLENGGYNVLRKPYDSREVFWVIRHAWLDWRSEVDRMAARTNPELHALAAH